MYTVYLEGIFVSWIKSFFMSCFKRYLLFYSYWVHFFSVLLSFSILQNWVFLLRETFDLYTCVPIYLYTWVPKYKIYSVLKERYKKCFERQLWPVYLCTCIPVYLSTKSTKYWRKDIIRVLRDTFDLYTCVAKYQIY